MKKVVALLLVMVMSVSLCACGGKSGNKKAFDSSKAAYDNVDVAYEITEKFGEDIYEAWRVGIYDKDEISVEHLASELNLSEEELTEGIVYTLMSFTSDVTYEEATEEDKQTLREAADIYFTMFEEDLFSACPFWTIFPMERKGVCIIWKEISCNHLQSRKKYSVQKTIT